MQRQKPLVIGASFKKGHVEVSYKERFVDDENRIVEIDAPGATVKHPPHPDLMRALGMLSVHFANLCEQLHVDPAADDEEDIQQHTAIVDRFPVRGIKFKEEGDKSGVTIWGFRRLHTKQPVNMKAPFVKFNDANPTYMHVELFEEHCEAVRSELALFLEGKRGEEPQKEMQFPPDSEKAGEDEDDQQGQPGTPEDVDVDG